MGSQDVIVTTCFNFSRHVQTVQKGISETKLKSSQLEFRGLHFRPWGFSKKLTTVEQNAQALFSKENKILKSSCGSAELIFIRMAAH